MKFKALVKKFSYNQLKELCDKKDWMIPSLEDLKKITKEELKDIGFDEDYDLVWINNDLYKEDLREYNDENYKYLYSLNHKKIIIANMRFIEKCIVIKKEINNVK